MKHRPSRHFTKGTGKSVDHRSKTSDAAKTAVTLRWTAPDLAQLQHCGYPYHAELTQEQAQPRADGLHVWDAWPLAEADGTPIAWNGGELWFALAVLQSDDPEHRHSVAHIHHFYRRRDRFVHLAKALPAGFAPGSREWSGSALAENGLVTLFFTATGHRGEAAPTFHQRIFATSASVGRQLDKPFGEWSPPHELIQADGAIYEYADQDYGRPGEIKGFRDPAHFRDDDGTDYLLFTGSSAQTPGRHNGVIGLARADGTGDYSLQPPLVDACEVSNELERPHIVRSGGILYLFWSTQRGVFAPGIDAPTGLYGATASSISGPWKLLNGHGLVLANPPDNPSQAYSWWVLPDLSVANFVDYWRSGEKSTEQFGGTFGVFAQLTLDGTKTGLIEKDD